MSEQSLFRFDVDRCTGCSACVVACCNENEVGEGLVWRGVRTFNAAHLPGVPVHHYSVACNHCEEPACLKGCPAAAYHKDPKTGAVLLDGDRCIGCRYCTWVCPYGAPAYNPSSRVMEKCTFCSHRLAEDLAPACVVACPVDALGFVPRGEPGPLEVPGLPEVGLRPGLEVHGLELSARMPVLSTAGEEWLFPHDRRTRPGLRLREEWPLVAFTWILPILVAFFVAAHESSGTAGRVLFAILGVAAMAASTFHLGRPERAWRALLNPRSSWVSREILLVSAFFWPAVFHFWIRPLPAPGIAFVGALGFAALFAADKIYDIPGQDTPAFPHSAMTVLTGAYLLGLWLREPWIALPAGLLKVVLFFDSVRRGEGLPAAALATRVVAGFLWPLVGWLAGSGVAVGWRLAGPLLGELIDRARFYLGRRFLGIERQIDRDLEHLARRRLAERAVA